MAYLKRNGVQVYYEEAGSGIPVLLSHGYSATAQMWQGQMDALADDYRLIAWDMRGHGQTDSPDDAGAYSEAATVDDMAAVLDAVGVEKAVISGLSLGGYMSLAFNVKYPERVQALMLFDTGPGYKNPVGREGWNETAMGRATTLEEKGLDALGRGAEVRLAQHRSAQGLAHAARGMLAQFDSRIIESLPDIKVPAMVLVGENDQPFIGASQYMAAKIPGAKLVTIPGAGHAANIDQPQAFNDAVRTFLAETVGAPAR
ncbi:MAG: alpha/beta fold hydrolase [Dehalococcoidia bacterium]